MVYAQCSGPGGLELAEFIADRLALAPGMRLLDVGCNRGYQSCFIAREYGVQVVAIDPWDDRADARPHVEHARDNAVAWGVEGAVLPLKLGVPKTPFVDAGFDAVYCSTALEMVRAFHGEKGYGRCLEEIRRVLRPGALFGLAEPMHHDRPIPEELLPLVSQKFGFKDCFRGLDHTTSAVEAAGFEVIESALAPDADHWWQTFVAHDPFCREPSDENREILALDDGRWVTFGYVVARRPA